MKVARLPLPIGSSQTGPIPTAPRPASSRPDLRTLAQKLFFDAALGDKAQVSKTAQASEPAVVPARIEPIKDMGTADAARPTRILRPGSLLDIRV